MSVKAARLAAMAAIHTLEAAIQASPDPHALQAMAEVEAEARNSLHYLAISEEAAS